jgi:Ser-tRNA(Ala) deacylase AlaX
MAETKQITAIHVVTDSENGYDNIGDIDGGGIDPVWLKKHIKNHGHQGLLDKLAWINYQVWSMVMEINTPY